MKIRNGFVSNSSSSSFVVIGTKEMEIPKLHNAYIHNNVLMIPQTFGGEYQFTDDNTCEKDKYNDFPSRLNYAALVAWQKEGPNGWDNKETPFTDMLVEIITETFENIEEVKINFRWDDDISHYSYMDPMCIYDSSYLPCGDAGSDNAIAIFASKQTLKQFLFCVDTDITVRYD